MCVCLAPPSSTQDSDVEPDDVVVDTALPASSLERAQNVINTGRLTLDYKQGVFVVVGASEPHVVRLHPRQSCSCPATSQCYHLIAAKMSIGMPTDTKGRTINLTQLRRNKRKNADKTSGRKRPRVHDVDVVAAGDADDQQAAQLEAQIRGTQPSQPEQHPPSASQQTIDPEICHVCQDVNPPARKCRRATGDISWIGCDKCPRWFHCLCVGVHKDAPSYECDYC